MGAFSHACEGDAVFKLTNPEKMPKFNHPVYTESKQEMGKVDEIFGAINDPVSYTGIANFFCVTDIL